MNGSYKNINPILLLKLRADEAAEHTVVADFSAAAVDATMRIEAMDGIEDMVVMAKGVLENRDETTLVFKASGQTILSIANAMALEGFGKIVPYNGGGNDRYMAHRPDPDPDDGRGTAVKRVFELAA